MVKIKFKILRVMDLICYKNDENFWIVFISIVLYMNICEKFCLNWNLCMKSMINIY